MATAVRFLGHPYVLTGTVVPGKQLGRRLGIPTANLRLPEEAAVPKFGVYACRCRIDGAAYPAVTNVGTRPTVEGPGILPLPEKGAEIPRPGCPEDPDPGRCRNDPGISANPVIGHLAIWRKIEYNE